MTDIPALIGRYHVERLIGQGGMGVLYLARDPVIDRHVALKLLRVNGEDLRSFYRDAKALAKAPRAERHARLRELALEQQSSSRGLASGSARTVP